jgi:sugar/nucleoside kinase (ribokinase family)
MAKIITIGEILVEIMTKNIGQSFEEEGEFTGPFPSGAPAIFIDQAAKTGSPCAMVSRVGDDGFGRLNVNRLKRDGVNVDHIEAVPGRTTGIAFVTYKENGDRDFIFTTKDSAAAVLSPEDVKEELFDGCQYFHIMGCSVFSDAMIEILTKAISIAKAKSVRISFDPNIRLELLKDEKLRNFMHFALRSCDVFLPGENELKWITGIENEEKAVRYVLEQSASCVVVKRGSRGSKVYERVESFDVLPYPAEEVDPTGAGDCFAGTFISLLSQGRTLREAAQYASAAGAFAVTKKGPMEGTTTLKELEDCFSLRKVTP